MPINDPTDRIAIEKGLAISFTHIATGNVVEFKSFLKSFKDDFRSNWNAEDVYGRMDPISVFQNTKRVISISWDVIAINEAEAIENLTRVSILLNMLYPVYDQINAETSVISASPLLRMKFANWSMEAAYSANFNKMIAGAIAGAKIGAHIGIHPNDFSGPVNTQIAGGAALGATIGALFSAIDAEAGLVGYSSGFSFEPDLENGTFMTNYGKLQPVHFVLSTDFTVLHTQPLGWDKKTNTPRNLFFPYGINVTLPFKQKSAKGNDINEKVKKIDQASMEGTRRSKAWDVAKIKRLPL